MVRRWGRFSSRVRHWGVPDSDKVPEISATTWGSAVDVGSDAPAWARWAERAANGGVVDIWRAFSGSPSAPRINAQRIARSDPYNAPNCLPPKKLRREIQ